MSAVVNLITGLQGNGKTLYTICEVKALAEKENRQVFVSGIEILDPVALPWKTIDPKEWYTAPIGSIIIIDEAHKTFPLRPSGSQVPAHVLPIAELRHEGQQLFLITQHPSELDVSVRRRVGRHLHLVRRFGFEVSRIREWQRCVENCDKTNANTQDEREWIFKKEAYAWYKSAEAHTIMRKLPKKLLWLAVAPVLCGVAIWYLIGLYGKLHSGEMIKKAAGQGDATVSLNQAPLGPSSGVAGPAGAVLTPAQYAAQFQPRIEGLAHTAPVYDQATRPVHVPYPAACVTMGKRCSCYTQQATKLQMSDQLCRDIVAGGFFVAWDDQGQQRIQPVASPRPEERLDGGNTEAIGINAGYQPQRAPFQSSQSPQVEQDSAKSRANRIKGG